jgi:hypothetical protein
MLASVRKTLFFIFFVVPMLPLSGHADSYSDIPADQKDLFWANEVVKGGYILHFRHGERNRYTTSSRTPETNVTSFDAVALALGMRGENEDFGIMTCLTDEGKAESKLVGRALKILGVGMSDLISSPSCRARQTAYFAFGTEGRIVNSLLHRTSVRSDQHSAFTINLRENMLRLHLEPGKNAIMTGHVGTLNYGESVLFEKNEVGNMSDRDDIGFVVIERTKNDTFIARHMFRHFSHFTQKVLSLPLN